MINKKETFNLSCDSSPPLRRERQRGDVNMGRKLYCVILVFRYRKRMGPSRRDDPVRVPVVDYHHRPVASKSHHPHRIRIHRQAAGMYAVPANYRKYLARAALEYMFNRYMRSVSFVIYSQPGDANQQSKANSNWVQF